MPFDRGNGLVVKICGITDTEAARGAAEAGADAIGFIFYPPSRCHVAPALAGAIGRDLPRRLIRVGVFVDAGLAAIVGAVEAAGLDAVQLHGGEAPEFCAAVRRSTGRMVIKAHRVRDRSSLNGLVEWTTGLAPNSPPDWFLLDTDRPGRPGGTGEAFDWSLARAAREELALPSPVLLAGGLTPENVADALDAARPDGVDVSSGVETAGHKDVAKIHAFVEAVRRWERERRVAAGG